MSSTSLRSLAHQSTRSFATSSRCASTGVAPRNVLTNPEIEPPLVLGPTQMNRYEEHYRNTLAPSLLYMTYDPDWTSLNASERLSVASTSKTQREWDPSSPYSKNRPSRPARGVRNLQPGGMQPNFQDPTKDLVQLDRLVLTSFCKEAMTNKHALLPLITQVRNITGISPKGSFADPSQGIDKPDSDNLADNKGRGHVSVIRTTPRAASFKIRAGVPIGVQAVLPRPLAYNFMEVLINFVLPKLRTFPGFLLPPASQPPGSAAAMSGVVSVGLGPEAMSLFPQLEINWDAYPNRGLGFQLDFITNQRGPRATEKARQMLSGMGMPFVRRGDAR